MIILSEAAKLVVRHEESDKGRIAAKVCVSSNGAQQVLHALHLLLGPRLLVWPRQVNGCMVEMVGENHAAIQCTCTCKETSTCTVTAGTFTVRVHNVHVHVYTCTYTCTCLYTMYVYMVASKTVNHGLSFQLVK